MAGSVLLWLWVPEWAKRRLTWVDGPPGFSYALQILPLAARSKCIVCAGVCSTKSGVCGPWRAHGQIWASALLPINLFTLPLVMVNKHWLWHRHPSCRPLRLTVTQINITFLRCMCHSSHLPSYVHPHSPLGTWGFYSPLASLSCPGVGSGRGGKHAVQLCGTLPSCRILQIMRNRNGKLSLDH